MQKIAVQLTQKEWYDIANFIRGDIDNMNAEEAYTKEIKRLNDILRKASYGVSNVESRTKKLPVKSQ